MALLLHAGQAGAAAGDELLPAQAAFRVSAQVLDPERIEVTWNIAPDYYMYQGRFEFRLEGSADRLGTPVFPPGEAKSDEFFGDVVIHRARVRIELPIERAAGVATPVRLAATGQGCNEPVGVCYPPHTQHVALELPVLADAGTSAGSSLTQGLRNLLGDSARDDGADGRFLPVDEAFRIDVFAESANGLRADIEIADGYYLYRDKLAFSTTAAGAVLGNPSLPPGVRKQDEYFGDTVVYYGRLAPRIAVALDPSAGAPASLPVQVAFQGCAEDGICYPPTTRTIEVALGGGGAGGASAGPLEPSSGAGSAASELAVTAFWPYMLAAFGTGLLLTFTPCVLPMIPIVSGIVVGQGGGRLRGGALSALFVLGTAITYTVTGAVAGATGEQLQAWFQSPWIIGGGAVALAVMAAATAGLIHVQVPNFIQSHAHVHVGRLGAGATWMPLLAGMLSALIVGACVSPLLISALSVALVAGDPWLGAAIMFSMALGMGLVLVLAGFGAGALLPRTGPWTHRVRQLLAFALLAVAVYLLAAIPALPVTWLWTALIGAFALWLLRLSAPGRWRWISRGTAALAAAWAVAILLAGAAGDARDPLAPLTAGWWRADAGVAETASTFHRVSTPAALEQAMQAARADGKAVFIDYYADWCVDCLRMERSTFRDDAVERLLADRFVALRIDVTDPGDPDSRALKQRFGVYGPPAMLFFDRHGRERRDLRLYGYRDGSEFVAVLRRVVSGSPQRLAGEQQPLQAADGR